MFYTRLVLMEIVAIQAILNDLVGLTLVIPESHFIPVTAAGEKQQNEEQH